MSRRMWWTGLGLVVAALIVGGLAVLAKERLLAVGMGLLALVIVGVLKVYEDSS